MSEVPLQGMLESDVMELLADALDRAGAGDHIYIYINK